MQGDLIFGMAGSGGDGIVSAGEAMIAAAAFEGYHSIMTKSFGSQIRGGESSCRVRVSTQPIGTSNGPLDVAIALSWDDFLKFGAELQVEGSTVVIYEAKTGVAKDRLPLVGVAPADVLAVPIADISKRSAGTDKAKNTVVLGLIAGWFELGRASLLHGIHKKLAKKGPEVLAAAERAFAAGLEYARANPLTREMSMAPAIDPPASKMLTDGNEMCAIAAIIAGCRFYGGYPITPSTEIMQYLSREIWRYGGAVLQAEDEIAGIGAAVGASFAGVKSMTATSGPGMSLKTEMIGLATIAELPLVVVNVQRGGPATGLPTKPEQGDLFQACFATHGDSVRPVLAPTCVADTFDLTVEAFNLAERYQTPVILLSDQEIGQRKETVNPIDASRVEIVDRLKPTAAELADYARFRVTGSGISPITCPGEPGGNYLAAGIEHNEHGAPTASGLVHAKMNEKRFQKLAPLKKRRDLFHIEGDPAASMVLVSWGSTAGACREAFARATEEGLKLKLIIPKLVYPVAEEIYRELFHGVRAGLVVESSHQGQLYRLLRMFVDVPEGVASFCRSGANPFAPREIVQRLQATVRAIQRGHSDSLRPQE